MLKCFNPYFGSPDGINMYPFPCGSCPACRKAKSLEWSTRIMLESKSYDTDKIAFVTLTYDNEHCPSDYSLSPRDLTLFLKRLRRSLSRRGSSSFRYFACGEYGELRGRPHYHLILFGFSQKDFDLVEASWKLGRIDVQIATSVNSVASYAAGYVTKKQKASSYGDRLPPFNRQSKGLGSFFVDGLKTFIPALRIGKFFFPLGRYLRNRLAERLGILEEVKKEGLYRLNEFFRPIYYEYKSKFALPFENALAISISAWQSYIAGEKALILSQHKLFLRKDL